MSVMKGEPMPKAITDFLHHDSESRSTESKERTKFTDNVKADHFVKNFDANPTLIIYHTHVRIH